MTNRCAVFVYIASRRGSLISCIYEILPALAIVGRGLSRLCFSIVRSWLEALVILYPTKPIGGGAAGGFLLVLGLATSLGHGLLSWSIGAQWPLNGREGGRTAGWRAGEKGWKDFARPIGILVGIRVACHVMVIHVQRRELDGSSGHTSSVHI